MKRLSACLILALSVIVAACATLTMPVVSPAAPTQPPKQGVIRFSQQGSANVKDVSWLLALDALQAQGYTIRLTEFAKSDLMAAALEKGEIDFAPLSPSIAWAAVAKGAGIRMVVGGARATWYLVGTKALQACRDLDGQALAFSTRQAAGYILFEQYVKEQCPEANPEILLISQSQNRVAALQAGEADGAYLELADWLSLDAQAPGKYHVIIDYGKDYPDFHSMGFFVHRSWARQHPEIVKDFVRALLIVQRQLTADPGRLQAEITKRFDVDAIEAQTTAEAYLAQGVWDANGGVTPQSIQYTIGTLASAGTLPPSLKVQDVADLSYLNAVLAEIGQQ